MRNALIFACLTVRHTPIPACLIVRPKTKLDCLTVRHTLIPACLTVRHKTQLGCLTIRHKTQIDCLTVRHTPAFGHPSPRGDGLTHHIYCQCIIKKSLPRHPLSERGGRRPGCVALSGIASKDQNQNQDQNQDKHKNQDENEKEKRNEKKAQER